MAKNLFLKYHTLSNKLYLEIQGPPSTDFIEVTTKEKYPSKEEIGELFKKLGKSSYKKRNINLIVSYYFKKEQELIQSLNEKYSLKTTITYE